MRKLRQFVFIEIIISIFCINSFGQEMEYKVLTKSGAVVLLNDKYDEVTDVNIGDILFYNDAIEIKNGGYVVLVDSNLQSIEIAETGIYDIANIDTLISIKLNSISKNITEFILNEMSSQENKNNEMKTLGAVVRKPVKFVEAACPKYGKILDTLYNFTWHPLKSESRYIFRLFNSDGNTIYMDEYSDTSVILNLNEFNLKYDVEYYWTVNGGGSSSTHLDSIAFKLLSPKQRVKIYQDIENLKDDFISRKSSFNNFIVARYLISEELYESAISYLNKSIELQPESEFYWANCIEYLRDIGMEREAVMYWNKSPFSYNSIK